MPLWYRVAQCKLFEAYSVTWHWFVRRRVHGLWLAWEGEGNVTFGGLDHAWEDGQGPVRALQPICLLDHEALGMRTGLACCWAGWTFGPGSRLKWILNLGSKMGLKMGPKNRPIMGLKLGPWAH